MATSNKQRITFFTCVVLYIIVLFLTRPRISNKKTLVNILDIIEFQKILNYECAKRGFYYQLYFRLKSWCIENNFDETFPVNIPTKNLEDFWIKENNCKLVFRY